MSRKCELTNKGPLVGNKVSHANNKTKMRQLPNLKLYKMTMEDGTVKKVRIAVSTIRTLRKQEENRKSKETNTTK